MITTKTATTKRKKMAVHSLKKLGALCFWCFFLCFAICGEVCSSTRSDKETRERFYGTMPNSSSPESNDGSLAKMFDRVLEKEFSENEQSEGFEILKWELNMQQKMVFIGRGCVVFVWKHEKS